MFGAIKHAIVKEFNSAVDTGFKAVQRRLLRIVLKIFFAVAGIAALTVGLIILGSQYVGVDLMLMLAGILFLFAFFLA